MTETGDGGGRPRPGQPLTAPVLRGRAAELARLDELIMTVRTGAGEIIVIEGAAGLGKTRLLGEVCGRAARAGLLVAASAADELDQVTPWGPLLRALSASGLLDSAELDELRGLSDQRLAVMERMHSALETASTRHPVLIALDDLQWADAATLLALAALPRELFSYPVGWLLARRPLPSPPALEALLARLDEAGAGRLHLGPLEAADAAALAADVAGPRPAGPSELPGPELAGLPVVAEGNPFYIIELLRAAAVAPRPAPGNPAAPASELPGAVRAAVTRHLRSLSQAGRQLLSVASVLGREFSVAELAEMTGQRASQLMPAVEEALAAEVFAEASDRIAFRHELLRQAVYEDLSLSLRTALHRDAADALRRTGAPVARIAGQLAVGARPGDAAAISALSDAVRELLPTSPGAAADLALRALELSIERDRRPELVLSAAHALALAGRGREALALGRRYLASGQLPAPTAAALELDLRQAWLLERDFPYPDPLSESLVNDPAADPVVRALAFAVERASGMWVGRGEEVDHELDHAYQLVLDTGRALEFGTVAYLRVSNSMLRGRLVEALARAEAGLKASRQLERPRSSGTHEVLTAVALGGNGRYAEALAMLRSAMAASAASGRPHFLVRCQWLRAFQLLAQGNLEDARGEGQTAAATADEFGYPDHRAHGLVIMAEAALRQGDMAAVQAALARFGPAEETGPMNDRYWAGAIAADARNDTTGVAAALAPLRAQLDRGAFSIAVSQHHRLPALVGIALRAGDASAAASFAHAAATLAERNPGVDSLAAAGAYARGLIEQDVASLREAVGLACRGQARLLEAAVHEDFARMLTGGPDAVEQLQAAYRIYVSAGAHRDTARVRAALRSLGVHTRQATVARPRQGWDSLTRSELAVVDLVGRGMTNRQAASALFLSPDTVNTHLRHAFMKLDIRSRVELARLAAQREKATS